VTSSFLVTPPQEFVISVTRGADCEFSVNRIDANQNAVPWNAAVSIAIDVQRDFPVTFTAVVTGSQAQFLIPSATADQVHNSTRWRIYMVTSGPTVTTAAAVGHFFREDGGQQC
jgi:hypothetical protein